MRCIDDEIPFEIPDSWEWCRGYSIMNQMSSTKPQGDEFQYIDIESINNNAHKIERPKILLSSNAPSRASRYIKTGDTLFSMVRPYLENIAFVDNKHSDGIASTGFFVCSPNMALHPKYLFNLMTSKYVVMGLNAKMKGDNSPSINNENISLFYYPVPPLPEQQRIVESIEQTFALIDRIEADKSGLSKAIKQAKAKVLDLAIRGKLVPQDPNDEPASVLLERIKAEKQASAKGTKKLQKQLATTSDNSHYPFDIPENWIWCKFGDISDYGRCLSAQPEQIDLDDWILDLEDIEKDTGRVLAYITYKERKSASSKHIFKKGQLLYSKYAPISKQSSDS